MRRFAAGTLAWWRMVATLVAAGLLVSACASSGTSSGGASSSAAASSSGSASATRNATVCQDVAALRASLSKLVHVPVSKGAASTLAADVKDIKAQVTTLANDARTQWSSQIEALNSALAKLQTAVTGVAHGGSLSSVGSALGAVRTAAQQLLTAAGAQCPSSSPSSP